MTISYKVTNIYFFRKKNQVIKKVLKYFMNHEYIFRTEIFNINIPFLSNYIFIKCKNSQAKVKQQNNFCEYFIDKTCCW